MTSLFTKQKAKLTRFCQSYMNWVERGAPNGNPYRRDKGLCWNILHSADDSAYDPLYKALNRESYPFNEGHEDYYKECVARRCHLNKKRLEWVLLHSQE